METPRRLRLLAALCGFLLAAALAFTFPRNDISDLYWPLRGAEALLAGENPYTSPRIEHDKLYHPLPALILVTPLTILPDRVALGVFSGLSAALLVYGMSRQRADLHRFWLLLSSSFWLSVTLGQWSLLMLASFYLPALLFLSAAKPNLALAPTVCGAGGFRTKTLFLVMAGVFTLASVAIFPYWPASWLSNLATTGRYLPVVLLSLGLPGLVFLLRRQDREASIFFWVTCMPLAYHAYDQAFLWLTTRSWRSSLTLVAFSWGWLASPRMLTSTPGAPEVLALMYLPTLILVLRPQDVLLGRKLPRRVPAAAKV